MKKYFLSFLFLSNSLISFAQALLFEPGVISNNGEFGLTVSPDGQELFFVKSFGGRDTLQLFSSKRTKHGWSMPVRAAFGDTRQKQIDPAFSPDGNMILFNSTSSGRSDYDIYISRRTEGGWSSATPLSDSINTQASEFYATISRSGTIYFTRRTKSNDIYKSSFIEGKYRAAELLESTINTDGNESNPYISPDEDFIIYFADYKNGEGQTDLYVSFNRNNRWSRPISLGKIVNTEIGEFCPAIDVKNKLFIFSRTGITNGKRVENIYSVPVESLGLDALKERASWK